MIPIYRRKKYSMKHLLEYEAYGEEEILKEGNIPVYDEQKFIKNVHVKPEMDINANQVCATIEGLLDRVESGELQKVSVVADVPTQGKNAPQYVRDLMAQERRRLGIKYSRNPEEFPEGGRLEVRKTPDGDPYQEFTGEINVFIDSEFVVLGVVREPGKDHLLAIPASYALRAKTNPSIREYYTTKILPQYIEEIHYTPAK